MKVLLDSSFRDSTFLCSAQNIKIGQIKTAKSMGL